MRAALVAFASVLLLSLAAVAPVEATSYDGSPSWSRYVRESEMVAVVEVITSGIGVSQVRIVESWKGPAAGSVTTINSGGWIGERFLIAGSRRSPSGPRSLEDLSRLLADGSFWWYPDLPGDWSVRAEWKIDARGRFDDPDGVLPRPTVAQLRRALSRGAAPPMSEAEHLRWLADGLTPKLRYRGTSAEALTTAILDWGSARAAARDRDVERARRILEEAGGGGAIKVLQASPASRLSAIGFVGPTFKASDWPRARDELIGAIERRIEADTRGVNDDDRPAIAQDDSEARARALIAELRAMFGDDPSLWKWTARREFWWTFAVLARDVPEAVVPVMIAGRLPSVDGRQGEAGAAGASYIGRVAAGDRKQHLVRLMETPDAYVRAAAAVYLAFEAEAVAIDYLERLATEPGVPGRWAALTLARYGRRSAVPRVFELFNGSESDRAAAPEFVVYLRARAFELLSNSAQASGIAQPAPRRERAYYEAWWKTHGARVRLTDPWLPQRRVLRID